MHRTSSDEDKISSIGGDERLYATDTLVLPYLPKNSPRTSPDSLGSPCYTVPHPLEDPLSRTPDSKILVGVKNMELVLGSGDNGAFVLEDSDTQAAIRCAGARRTEEKLSG